MTRTEQRIDFFNKFAAFTTVAVSSGIDFLVTCFYRPPAEQEKLFNEGKSMCDGYTKKSRHQLWLDIDIVLVDDTGQCVWAHVPEYDTLGQMWEAMGGEWGGRWASLGDIYHFQYEL